VNPTPANADEIERYLQGVREALADLPPEVRDDLLEDLPAHLADVAAEAGGEPLDYRLGRPTDYAAELRAAAGIGAPVPARRWAGQALGRSRHALRRVNVRVGPLIGYSTVAEFGDALRPGWWVLRGYAVGMLALGLIYSDFRLVPRPDPKLPIDLAVIALAIGVSVRVGRLWLTERRRVLLVLANIAAVLLVAGGAAKANEGPGTVYTGGGTGYYYQFQNGPVADVYPYDENGNPLTGVRLYDQNGNLLQFGDPYRCANRRDGFPAPQRDEQLYRYPLCPLGPGHPLPSSSPSPGTSPNTSSSTSPGPSASSSPAPSHS
jgi:hypothetical protein